jgi:hypothetical protein
LVPETTEQLRESHLFAMAQAMENGERPKFCQRCHMTLDCEAEHHEMRGIQAASGAFEKSGYDVHDGLGVLVIPLDAIPWGETGKRRPIFKRADVERAKYLDQSERGEVLGYMVDEVVAHALEGSSVPVEAENGRIVAAPLVTGKTPIQMTDFAMKHGYKAEVIEQTIERTTEQAVEPFVSETPSKKPFTLSKPPCATHERLFCLDCGFKAEGIRSLILIMALKQEAKMARRDHDRGIEGWRTASPAELLRWMDRYYTALQFAVERGDQEEILDRCVDLSNLAAMLADVGGPAPLFESQLGGIPQHG